jgi:hypothetical protein
VPSVGDASVNAVTSDGAVVELDNGAVYSVSSSDQSTSSSWSPGDTISVGANDDSLANLDTNEAVSATHVGDSSNNDLYLNAGDHTQQTNSSDGSIIVLDDGSIWEVADPSDQLTAALWLDASSITVQEDSSSPPYTLVNTDDQSSVQASYVGDE